MTIAMPDPAFDTAAAQPQAVQTRVLVISHVPGMGEMVARNVARGDPSLAVTSRRITLTDLAAEGRPADTDLVIFEIRPGDDGDLVALRRLRAASDGALKFLGLTTEALPLAVARALMEAGLDEVMPLTAVAPRLQDVSELAPAARETQARRGGDARDGLIIATAAARGGIGATGFTLNLAALLAQTGKARGKAARTADMTPPRIAVIDLDFQNGVLGASIDAVDSGAYLEMLQQGLLADHDLLTRALTPHPLGFDVLPAPATFAPLDAMTADMMSVLLDELRLSYDVVLLDLPRALSDWIAPVLSRADRMFLLSDTNVHTVRQARRMLDFFADDNSTMPVDIVINTEKKPLSAPAHVREAEKFLDTALRHWLPRDDRAARRAAGLGQPLVTVAPKSPVAKAMAPIVASLRDALTQTQRRRA